MLEMLSKTVEDIRFTTELITPELAQKYLARNDSNRAPKIGWQKMLAETMRRGEWQLNGEAIKFADTGRLLDGQNRLHAIIRCGIPQYMLIARGIKSSAFDTLDQGVKRTAGDIFSIAGYKNAVLLAATLRHIRFLTSDRTDFSRAHSPRELESVLSHHPTSELWCAKFAQSKQAKRVGTSIVPAVLTVGAELHDEETGDEFLRLLSTGAGMKEGHPVLLLRERLIESRASALRRLSGIVNAAYTVKAWNAFVAGREVRLLRFRPYEEDFPELI